MNRKKYHRILLKLSGESLQGSGKSGIDYNIVDYIANEIVKVAKLNVEIGVVIGGGNIFRGLPATKYGINRFTGDQMGMLATVINSLALQSALEAKGIYTRLQSAIRMEEVAEPLLIRRAIRHLEKKRIVIFAAGTGDPYFTTDTAAALRAVEINAELILKGTRVDGIYDSDPEKNKNAKFYSELSFDEVIEKNLKVMDLTAITLCKENNLPIIVFNMNKEDNLKKIIQGYKIGTTVK
ncbi:MAG: UMP kinase [Ignavibacteria bacterium]|nr:UMP kinase [Ignavibacteria bacterium]